MLARTAANDLSGNRRRAGVTDPRPIDGQTGMPEVIAPVAIGVPPNATTCRRRHG